MKAVTSLLIVIGIIAILAGLTGVQHVTIAGGHITLTEHSLTGRITACVIGLLCVGGAYGCLKRQFYGWWIVTVLCGVAVCGEVVWSVWNVAQSKMDVLGVLLGLVGEFLKIALMVWFYWKWWRPRKSAFGGFRKSVANNNERS